MSSFVGILLYFIIGIGITALIVIPSIAFSTEKDGFNLGEMFALTFIWPLVMVVFVVINLYKALKKLANYFKS